MTTPDKKPCNHVYEIVREFEDSIGEYRTYFKCNKCDDEHQEYSSAMKTRKLEETLK